MVVIVVMMWTVGVVVVTDVIIGVDKSWLALVVLMVVAEECVVDDVLMVVHSGASYDSES
ncbi:hypothetical protein HAX54_039296, partial [Datura stramonium]|nr:hypothetical protein [Datura stramonium]